MTQASIRAVLFDLGGTLEEVYYDHPLRLAATEGLLAILSQHQLDPGLPLADLYAVIDAGMSRYGQYRHDTELELPPERVWSEFVFANTFPASAIIPIAEELAFYYDTCFYQRTMRAEVPSALQTLRDRGLRLGLISNIYSRGQVPYNLDRYHIRQYFEIVVISSEFGWRKPHPSIFEHAAQLLELQPAQCAYVGDTLSRDVRGAQRAGYGMAIQIKSFLTRKADSAADTDQPDAVVTSLTQVIDLVASRAEGATDV